MTDVEKQLQTLRAAAGECKLIRDQATSSQKKELFARLADHLSVLASEVEQALAASQPARRSNKRG